MLIVCMKIALNCLLLKIYTRRNTKKLSIKRNIDLQPEHKNYIIKSKTTKQKRYEKLINKNTKQKVELITVLMVMINIIIVNKLIKI